MRSLSAIAELLVNNSKEEPTLMSDNKAQQSLMRWSDNQDHICVARYDQEQDQDHS